MGGGSYLTNRNINNNLALKKQQEVDPIQAAINGTSFSAPTVGSAAYNMLQQKNSNDARAAYIASQNRPTLDNTLTPMAVEAPVATVEPTPIMSTTRTTDGLFGNFTPTAAAPTVDINKVIATNKYGGALKYSELSPEDQAVVDARRASGVDVSPNAYKGATALMGDVSYGVGEQYGTPEEALTALPSYLGGLAEQRVGTDEKFNTKNFDPSEFTMAGVSPVGGVSGRAAKESAVDYLTKNNIPMSKEVDGETRYLTTGLGSDVLYDTLGEDGLPKGGGSFEDRGPVGSYSTIHVKPVSALNDPVLSILGTVLPPLGVAVAAAKGISGETLHAGDWLKLGTAGLNYIQTKFPPSDAQVLAKAFQPTVVTDPATGLDVVTETAGDNAITAAFDQKILDINNVDNELYQEIWEAAEGIGDGFLNSGLTQDEIGTMLDIAASGDEGILGGVEASTIVNDFVNNKPDLKVYFQGLDQGAEVTGDPVIDAGTAGSVVEALDTVTNVADYFTDYNDFYDTDLNVSNIADSFGVEDYEVESVLEDIITTNPDASLNDITNELSESFNTEEPITDLGDTGTDGESTGVADVAAVANVAQTADTAAVANVAAIAETAQTAAVAAVAEMADTANVAEVAKVATTAAIASMAPTAEVAKVAETAAIAAVANIAETADIASTASVAATAAVAAIANVAETASVAEVAEVAKTAATAEVAKVAATAAVASMAPTAEVAKVAETAAVAAIADIAGTASVAEVAKVASVAATAAVAAVAKVAATASVAEIAEVAKVAAVAAVADVSGIEAAVAEGVGALGGAIGSGFEGLGEALSGGIGGLGETLGGLFEGLSTGLSTQQTEAANAARNLTLATRTTDSLFSDFKGFDTEIGSDQEMVKLLQRNRR